MENLEFRVFDTNPQGSEEGPMYYGPFGATSYLGIDFQHRFMGEFHKCEEHYNLAKMNPERFIWMMYTGHKDKEGTKIFEGDIVRLGEKSSYNKYEYAVVKWEKKRAGFVLYVGRPTVGGFKALKMAGGTHKLVIGNVYDNPSMMTKYAME